MMAARFDLISSADLVRLSKAAKMNINFISNFTHERNPMLDFVKLLDKLSLVHISYLSRISLIAIRLLDQISKTSRVTSGNLFRVSLIE